MIEGASDWRGMTTENTEGKTVAVKINHGRLHVIGKFLALIMSI